IPLGGGDGDHWVALERIPVLWADQEGDRMSATATKRSAVSRRATANAALSGPPGTQPGTRSIRCAIYTRKSTEEGLNQEFNSLDAQRESAVAYVASQRNEGWTCVPDRYDDGGFTG